jgi:hypothetical protein
MFCKWFFMSKEFLVTAFKVNRQQKLGMKAGHKIKFLTFTSCLEVLKVDFRVRLCQP